MIADRHDAQLEAIASRLNDIANRVVVIETKLTFTYNFMVPFATAAIGIVLGVFVGVYLHA
jgi:tetrahydromethanopterin S-methyltransferase subunit G